MASFLGSLSISALLAISTATAFADTLAPPALPVARVEPVTDTHFGETVTDRYRWMENDKDRDWLHFLKGQNDHARAVLENLPGRDTLLTRIRQLSGDITATGKVQRAGDRLFFQQRPAGANNFKLFVREGNTDRLLVDPTALDTKESHVSLDWWEPSPDGTKLAYGLSKDGSEDSTLQIMEVASGRILPERIANTEAANPQWIADSSGFFYNQLTGKVATPERYLDSRARFHRLGTQPGSDPIVMARGRDPAVAFEKIQIPFVLTFSHSDYVLLALADVRSEARLFIAATADVLAGKAKWRSVAEFADEVTGFDLNGEDLYLLANRGHPRGRVLKVAAKAPDMAKAVEVVPESALVLQDMARSKDGLFLRSMDGGLGRLQRLGSDGQLVDIALPFDGTLAAVAADADPVGVADPNGGLVGRRGRPRRRYRAHAEAADRYRSLRH
jgi:prolyl oligopeptidase